MAHKVKNIIESNIYKIRAELNYTQKEFGELLGVSERMIQMYEAYVTTLPLDKALYICKRWNYSLDQIYLDFSKKYAFNKFSVNIRDFLTRNNNSIIFSMPDYYWNYLKEINRINNSDILQDDKKRLLAELDDKYSNDTNSVVWKYKIPVNDFLSNLKFGDDEFPYADIDSEETEHSKGSVK